MESDLRPSDDKMHTYLLTGVRTYRPYSVDGNWNTLLGYAYTRQFGKWQLTAGPTVQYLHSVDLTGTTQLERSTVNTTNLMPKLRLSYNLGDLGNIRLDCNPQWRWLHSARPDFEDFSVADYTTTLYTLLNLPWKLQLSTDLTLYSRTGYADKSLNTNDLVWNARLSRPFFKGSLVVMLDGFDILGQLSGVTRTVNGQGRTEIWTNVMPRYLLAHAVYHLNRHPLKPAEKREKRAERKERRERRKQNR
ncbi:MAG: hypothetical protein IJ209_01005 [Bacteroidaceae bacterium]|nr:hypothetical protein [Bacteroidaceae bacterium]